MFQFLYDRNYLNARNNEDYYHFGFVDVPIPSWEEILKEFDREFQIHVQTGDHEIFKLQDDFGFVLHQMKAISIVEEFLKQIETSHNIRKNQEFSALAYISLSALSKTYGRHKDVMDVWCWQMTGYTLWRVEGKYRNFEKVLEPGELIYVPRGMWHNTRPMTPRAGLSFGSEDSKTNL